MRDQAYGNWQTMLRESVRELVVQDITPDLERSLTRHADSVVAIFQAASVNDNGDGTSTLATEGFGDSNDLCQTERFRDQPIGAFCSGFLVAPDIIATAGHCVNANTLGSCRFVFGFYMESATSARLRRAALARR